MEKIIIGLITLIIGAALRNHYPKIEKIFVKLIKGIYLISKKIFSRGYFVFIKKKDKEIIDYLLDSKNKIYFSKQDGQFYRNPKEHVNYNGDFAGFLADRLDIEYQNVYKRLIKRKVVDMKYFGMNRLGGNLDSVELKRYFTIIFLVY